MVSLSANYPHAEHILFPKSEGSWALSKLPTGKCFSEQAGLRTFVSDFCSWLLGHSVLIFLSDGEVNKVAAGNVTQKCQKPNEKQPSGKVNQWLNEMGSH